MKSKEIQDLYNLRIMVFLDEAIFSPQTSFKRSWAGQYKHPQVQEKRVFLKTFALIAAISQKYGLTQYKIIPNSINSRDFIYFLEELKQKYYNQKLSIFMDNLSVHRCKIVKESMRQLGLIPIFSVPYFPQYNGIDSYFRQLKNYIREKQLEGLDLMKKQNKENVQKQQVIKLIKKQEQIKFRMV